MKKLSKILLAIVAMVSILFISDVYAKDDVEIKSVTLDTKSDNTTINSDATASGLVLNFDLLFKTKGDYAKYKVEVVNNSNEDYEISNTTSFSDSKYIKYDFIFDDDTSTVAKNSTKIMYVTVTYDKEVPVDRLASPDGYVENSELVVTLAMPTTNPKTGDTVLKIGLILLLGLIAALSLLASKKTKLPKTMIMMIALTLIVVPTTIYAAKKVEIKINSKVEINNTYTVYIKNLSKYCADIGSPYVGNSNNNEEIDSYFKDLPLFGAESSPKLSDEDISFSFKCGEDGYYLSIATFKGEKTWSDFMRVNYDMQDDNFKNQVSFDEYLNDIIECTYVSEDLEVNVGANDKIINDKTYYFRFNEEVG